VLFHGIVEYDNRRGPAVSYPYLWTFRTLVKVHLLQSHCARWLQYPKQRDRRLARSRLLSGLEMASTRAFLHQWGSVDWLQRVACKVCRSSIMICPPPSSMSFVIASGPGDFAFFNLLTAVINYWKEVGRLMGQRGFVGILCAVLALHSCSFTSIS